MKNRQEIFAESLFEAFFAVGINLPESKLKEIAENNLKVADNFLLFQKYERLVIHVAQKQFFSFEEIVKIGNFNNSYYDHLEKNNICKNAIFAPINSTSEEEIILYYEGENQIIPDGKRIYAYFKSKGFEVIKKAHPSLLINAMSELTEERLTEIGISSHVDIVLPTSVDCLLPDDDGDLCFLRVHRRSGDRKLILRCFTSDSHAYYAFLLRKMKV